MKKNTLTIIISIVVGICITVSFLAVRQTLAIQAAVAGNAQVLQETTNKVDSVIKFINEGIQANQNASSTVK